MDLYRPLPEPGTYRFVLRRYDRGVIPLENQAILVNGYDEATESLAAPLGGVTAHTVFLTSENARNYAVKIGWTDETERWLAEQRTSLSNEAGAWVLAMGLLDLEPHTAIEVASLSDDARYTPEVLREALDALERDGKAGSAWMERDGERVRGYVLA